MIYKLISIIFLSIILWKLKLFNIKVLFLLCLLHFIDTINFDYPIFIYLLTLFVLIFEIVKIEKSKNDKQ